MQRGIGDPSVLQEREREMREQIAKGTAGYFGAARARALREQLQRSRMQQGMHGSGSSSSALAPDSGSSILVASIAGAPSAAIGVGFLETRQATLIQ